MQPLRGPILLAAPNVDIGPERVEWTRKWIAREGYEKLK